MSNMYVICLQVSYNIVSLKVVITIQYFLIPQMVTFLSSHYHVYSRETSQIRFTPYIRPNLAVFTNFTTHPPLSLFTYPRSLEIG